MRIVKKILLVLAVLLLLFILVVFLFLRSQKPDYKAEIKLDFIEREVVAYFDEYGVPHIYTESEKDALIALGYVHAMERLWQMELMRRIAPGRLSEIFGEATLETDRFFAGIGLDEKSKEIISSLDRNHPSYSLAEAYLQGVNHFVSKGKKPLEFRILGIEKTPFTMLDMANIAGYMSFSFAMAQKTDPLMTYIQRALGEDYLHDFGLDTNFNTAKIPIDTSYRHDELSVLIHRLMNQDLFPAFHGSNSWVLGPERTESGQVLFANDPHIGFSQPGTWYESHIHTPQYEIYGYYLPGLAFPLLGHNRHYAYGMTMLENDDIDFFEFIPVTDQSYLSGTDTIEFTELHKTIRIKSSKEENITLKISHLGPIVNSLIPHLDSKVPVAMNWIYLQENNSIFEALYGLSHMKSIDDYPKSTALIKAPGLNIMYGDSIGNIGWIAAARLYRYQHNKNTLVFLNGSNGEDEKREYLPFEKNPHAINPSINHVYSANNQPADVDGFEYPGYYVPADRAERITDLLMDNKKWNKEHVANMLMDDISYSAREFSHFLVKIIDDRANSENEKAALSLLKNWNGSHHTDEAAPLVFNQCLYHYLENTFLDELGEERFQTLLTTHIIKQMIPFHIKNKDSSWWDDISTKDIAENRDDILIRSFRQAVSNVEKHYGKNPEQWKWKNAASLAIKHPLGSVRLLSRLFNVGPRSVSGGNETINNMIFTYSNAKNLDILAGPSTRRIIDFGDVENSLSILPTGQSGHIRSPFYKDQYDMFIDGKFRKMYLNKKDFEDTKNKMVFRPG